MPVHHSNDNRRSTHAERYRPRWFDSGLPRVGLISNPLSGNNRNGLGRMHQVSRRHPDVIHREACNPPEVFDALDAFASGGVELVVVNGGDGTIQAVLTGLFGRRPFKTMPALALLYGGTSNMLAKDFGLKGPQHSVFERLMRSLAAPAPNIALVRRPILKVESGGDRSPMFGMFFGAACIYRGIQFFHSKVQTLGVRGELAHGIIVARFLAALVSRDSNLVAPERIRVRLEQGRPMPENYLLFLISSLEKLILGLRPYWGRGPGPLHLTAVTANPNHLLRALAGFVRGRPNRHLNAQNGYYSREIESARMWLRGGFTLDGELYRTTAPQHSLTVSTGGCAHFVSRHE